MLDIFANIRHGILYTSSVHDGSEALLASREKQATLLQKMMQAQSVWSAGAQGGLPMIERRGR